MTKVDTALKIYECTKSEYIEHIKIRNNSIVAYLGIIGVILGGTLSMQNPRFEILLSIPFISLGTAFIVAQHNMVISSIGKFFSKDLQEDLPERLSLWENSPTLQEYSRKAVTFTTIGYLISLTAPSIISISLNWSYLTTNSSQYSILTWASLILTIFTGYIIIYAGFWRSRKYGENIWKKETCENNSEKTKRKVEGNK